MGKPLMSLREASEDFNAGKCQLRTEVEMRVGDAVTRWELVVDGEFVTYDNHGRPMYNAYMHRAVITLGEPEWEPDMMQSAGPRDVHVIAEVFGISLDAAVWTKGSAYAKE
jgi:hypothetical protein